MVAQRLDMHRLQELVRQHRLGLSQRELAARLKMGRNVAARYCRAIAAAGLLDGDPAALPDLSALRDIVVSALPPAGAASSRSSLAEHEATIREMAAAGQRPKRIFDQLRLRNAGFAASLSAVKRLCARLKRERGVSPEDVAIPVETPTGEVAQVDFGYVGMLVDPKTNTRRRAWVFVMTLGYSRHLFARVVFDQKIETWQELHVLAFEFFGGVPRVIVPDNLKAAIVRAAFGSSVDAAITRSYRELARHYGFMIDPTPPRSPQKKGKVEANVKYVKRSCFPLDEGCDLAAANQILRRWTLEIAGERIHGTTRRKPLEVFEQEERSALLALPRDRFEPITWKTAKVHPDTHIAFSGRLYSVPWRLVGREVWIRATPTSIAIFHNEERVATHVRHAKGYRSTNDDHLPDHRRDWRHRTRQYCEDRALEIGDDVLRYVQAIFDADDVLLRLRPAQSALAHLATFPKERANRACARALAFQNLDVRSLKKILREALDFEPLDDEPGARPVPSLAAPRFARPIEEILAPNLEIAS